MWEQQNRRTERTQPCQRLQQTKALRNSHAQLFLLLGALLFVQYTHAQGRPDIVWIRGGHSGFITDIAFSPDGKLIASISSDNTIKLWRASDGLLVRTPKNAKEVFCLSFSPDGTLLATGGKGEINLWRVSDGTLVRALTGHRADVFSVAFSPNGRLLASGGTGKTVKLWRVSDGHLMFTCRGHTGTIQSVSFTPDGKFFVSGSTDKTIKFWRISNGQLERSITSQKPIQGLDISRDGKLIATYSNEFRETRRGYNQIFESVCTISLWRLPERKFLRTLATHTGENTSLSFSPDGKMIMSTNQDNTIKLWGVANGKLLRTIKCEDIALSAVFSPDGKTILSGDYEGRLKLWRTADGTLQRTLTGHTDMVRCVAFSPDGRVVASGSNDNTVRLWRVSDGATIRSIEYGDFVLCIAFTRDGTLMAVGGVESPVQLWQVSDGKHVQTLSRGSAPIVFSPDGHLIAFEESNKVSLYRVSDGTIVHRISHRAPTVNSLAFTPDGNMIVVNDSNNTISLWRISDGERVYTLPAHSGEVSSVLFSPDGSLMASVSEENIYLWSVSDRTLIDTLRHTSEVTCVAFSPDGGLLASGCLDKTINIWRISDRKLIQRYDQEIGCGPNSIQFSPDGRFFVYGRNDATVVVARTPSASTAPVNKNE
jgi:WD40 repeat protein